MRSRFFRAIRCAALPIAAAAAALPWGLARADGGHGLDGGATVARARAPRRIGLAEAVRLGATEDRGSRWRRRRGARSRRRGARPMGSFLAPARDSGRRRAARSSGRRARGQRQRAPGSLARRARRRAARYGGGAGAAHRSRRRAGQARRGGARALSWISLIEADRVFALRQDGLAQAEALLRAVRAQVGTGVSEPLALALAQR